VAELSADVRDRLTGGQEQARERVAQVVKADAASFALLSARQNAFLTRDSSCGRPSSFGNSYSGSHSLVAGIRPKRQSSWTSVSLTLSSAATWSGVR
jgi:hypothetical protein